MAERRRRCLDARSRGKPPSRASASTPGRHVTARCVAAEPGQGIVFRRVDLPGSPDGAGAALPGALHRAAHRAGRGARHGRDGRAPARRGRRALQLDDLTVELDGPEPPIGDGSFQPYLTALAAGGLRRPAGRPGGLQGHRAVPADRGRFDLRGGAGADAPPHHDDRVGPSADRPPVGLLRHHARRLRPRPRRGADLRLRAGGGGAPRPGTGTGCRPRLDPDTLRRRPGRGRAALARRVRAAQGGGHPGRPRAGRRAGPGARRREQAEPPGQYRAGPLAPPDRTARRRRRDGHRQDPGRDPAPLSLPPRGSDHRGRGDQRGSSGSRT